MLRRWKFTDPDGILDTYTFSINPNKQDAPESVANVAAQPVQIDDRAPDSEMAPSQPQSMSWQGIFYTRDDRNAFSVWMNNARPVVVTDHRNQQVLVLLVSITSTRSPSRRHPAKEKYTIVTNVIGIESL